MIKIKSVWCEVEREDGTTLHTMVPIGVFIYKRDEYFTDNAMGLYSEKQVEELKNWEPGMEVKDG